MIDGSKNIVIVIIGIMFQEIVCMNELRYDVIKHNFQVEIY